MNGADLQQLLRRIKALEEQLGRTKVRERPDGPPGTWTPTFVGTGTAGTFTYAAQVGEYTRIGDRVFVNGRIRITAILVAPTGVLEIGGLPFTSGTEAVGSVLGGISINAWTGLNIVAGYTQVAGEVQSAVTTIRLVESGDNVVATAVQGGELTVASGAADIRFWGSYRCAS